MQQHAIVLVAHGSRDLLWRQAIEAVAARVSDLAPWAIVRCAYLELCPPTLPETATDLIASNVLSIRVFPLFLGLGLHARTQVPELIADIRTQYPALRIELIPSAGEHPQLIDMLAHIALDNLQSS